MHFNQLTQKKQLLECIVIKGTKSALPTRLLLLLLHPLPPPRLKHLPPLPPSVSLLTSLAPESLPTVLIPFALLHLPHLLYKMGRRDGEGVLRQD